MMGCSFPSFLALWNSAKVFGDLESVMYPLASVPMINCLVASTSVSICQYILQLMVDGAPSFRLMAWSSSQVGGKHCEVCSVNTPPSGGDMVLGLVSVPLPSLSQFHPLLMWPLVVGVAI